MKWGYVSKTLITEKLFKACPIQSFNAFLYSFLPCFETFLDVLVMNAVMVLYHIPLFVFHVVKTGSMHDWF